MIIFSKLSRSIPRSSRSSDLLLRRIGGYVRSGVPLVGSSGVEGVGIISKLGFLRGYFASIGSSKNVSNLSDFGYFFANPRARRFFSSEAPNKKKKSIQTN